jgi:hypothetical protein
MPHALSSKNAATLFLGLELATDQLRASLVDESLDLVGVESVDFDSELPEYQYVDLLFQLLALTRLDSDMKHIGPMVAYSQHPEMLIPPQ